LVTFTFPITDTVEAFVRRIPLAPLTVRPPPTVRPKFAPVVLNVPLTVTRPAVVMAEAAETVPLIVSAPNPFDELRILTVTPAPLIVTMLVVPVNVEPTPDVSQLPVTAHEPEAVIVPDVPPVIVTLATPTVEVPAVRVPPLFTTRLPPVRARFDVDRVALLFSVSVPAHRSPFVAIVKVAAAVGLNCTLLNSGTDRFPNVIVRAAPALKMTVPVPDPHDAEVEELVQVPVIVHDSEPKETYDAAAETFTFPETVALPEVDVRVPPESARFAVERVNVDFASVPEETVNVALTVVFAARVDVPAPTVRLLNAWVMVIVAVAVNVTVLVPAAKVAFAAVTVQFPPTLIVDPFAVSVPRVPIVTEPAVMPRLDPDVVRIVFPVGLAAVF
jgi:hypothetical protein